MFQPSSRDLERAGLASAFPRRTSDAGPSQASDTSRDMPLTAGRYPTSDELVRLGIALPHPRSMEDSAPSIRAAPRGEARPESGAFEAPLLELLNDGYTSPLGWDEAEATCGCGAETCGCGAAGDCGQCAAGAYAHGGALDGHAGPEPQSSCARATSREAVAWEPWNPTDILRETIEDAFADRCDRWRARASCLAARGYEMRADGGYSCLNSLWLLNDDVSTWPEGESRTRGWPGPREYFQQVVDLYAALSNPAGCGVFRGFDWDDCQMEYDLWQPGTPGYQSCARKVERMDQAGEYWQGMVREYADDWARDLFGVWGSCDCIDESFFGMSCVDGVRMVSCTPEDMCYCRCYALCNEGTAVSKLLFSCEHMASGVCP